MSSHRPPDWERLAATPQFRNLLRAKSAFVVPATVFFCVYYFALPILVGYFPAFMSRKILGPLNIAYVFALSQFVMAWIIAFLYTRAARRFDAMADEVVRLNDSPEGSSAQ
ncbi:MAG: DUF485 domain-containing protein [Acidobacteriota bacterium]